MKTKLRSLWHKLCQIPVREYALMGAFALMWVFNFCIFNQFDIMLNNQAEFGVTVDEVTGTFVGWALVVLVVTLALLVALRLVHRGAWCCVLALALGLGLSSHIQVLFFNDTDLMSLNGTIKAEYVGVHIFNTLLHLVIILAPLAVLLFRQKRVKKSSAQTQTQNSMTQKLALGLGLMLFGMQFVGIVSAAATAPKPAQGSELYYFSVDEQLVLSPQDNVIVFILDRWDNRFASDALTIDDGEQIFDGFVYYHDNISEYPSTYPSIASMLTDLPFEAGRIRQADYLPMAWNQEVLLSGLKQHNYKVNVLLDTIAVLSDFGDLVGKVDNLRQIDPTNRSVRQADFFDAMQSFARVRHAPNLAKFLFTNPRYLEISNYCVQIKNTPDRYPRTMTPTADLLFLDKLRTRGLSVDRDDPRGTFSLVHLNAGHSPFAFDQKLGPVDHSKSFYDKSVAQTRGTYEILREYMNQLRALGLYDTSTIILLGDHGWWAHDTAVPNPPATALMIKPKGSTGPLVRDNTSQLSHHNFSSTILELVGADDLKPAPSYYDIIAGGGQQLRNYHYVNWINLNSTNYVCSWVIDGDANLPASWRRVN